MPLLILIPAAAFLVSLIALKILLSGGLRHFVLDRPNERSLHSRPVPRTGGLAIVAGVLAAMVLARPPFVLLIGLVVLLVGVSVVDDLRGLSARVRLLAHVCAAAIFCYAAMSGVPAVVLGLVLFAIVWMTNLYNFMDGSDGLAGGMAVIGFGAYAVGAAQHGDMALASLCASVAASSAAFLYFNFAPARIFMGDAGSIPLGFLAAALGAAGWQRGLWPPWFGLLVFSPFIVDATVTLARRAARREAVWQAHREHYYQRLIRSGIGHRGAALSEYVLMLAAAASALWLAGEPDGMVQGVLAAWAIVYVVLAIAVDRRWARTLSADAPLRGSPP